MQKEIILKDGDKITVRPVRVTDAEALMVLFRKTFEQNHQFFTMTAQEATEKVKTVEDHVKWLENALEKQWLVLLAFYNDRIVGWGTIKLAEKSRQQHIGVVALVLLEEYTSRGIGSVLMDMMIDWSRNNEALEKLSLCVISNNQRAYNMYKKYGFIEEGRRVREFKHGPDEYYDEIGMYMIV